MIKTILLLVAAYCVGVAVTNRDVTCTVSPDAAKNVASTTRDIVGHMWYRTGDPVPLQGTWKPEVRTYP